MDKYAILKLQNVYNMAQLYNQEQHNRRTRNEPHTDPSKGYLNKELISPNTGSYIGAWKERIEEAEIIYGKEVKNTHRKGGIKAIEVMLSFSNGAIKDTEVPKWCEKNVEWLKETFGPENVLCATLHMDETNPHIHATIIPIDKRGHLCARSFIDGPFSLKKLQDNYGKAMGEFGLTRGEKNTKAKNQTLGKFYRSVTNADTVIPIQKPDQSKDEYIEELIEHTREVQLALVGARNQAQRTDDIINTRIANAFSDYKDGVNFYHQVLFMEDGEKERAKKKLEQLLFIEQAIPAPDFDTLIDALQERYKKEDNIKCQLYEQFMTQEEAKKEDEDKTALETKI